MGNIPTCVGKTLKMLSKIKHLTFRNVPNLLAFTYFQKSIKTLKQSQQAATIQIKASLFLFTCQRTVPTSFSRNVSLISQKKRPKKNSTINAKPLMAIPQSRRTRHNTTGTTGHPSRPERRVLSSGLKTQGFRNPPGK